MNTTQLVAKLAERLEISQAEAKRLLKSQLDVIADHLAAGQQVVLRGFGTLGVRRTAAHKGQLPGTDEKVLFPAHRQIFFRPAAALKEEASEWEAK